MLTLSDLKKQKEAEMTLAEVIVRSEQFLGLDHPETLRAKSNYAVILEEERYKESE